MILGHGGVKMILVDRYDHKIHFCGSKYAKKKYRIIPIMEILKFPYFNLNIFKVVQVFWEAVLLDRVL
jgi:hypothetical protein